MVQAVLFDLDGTLYDDRQYVRAGLLNAAATLEDETGRDLSADLLEAYFREGIRDRTFDIVLARNGLSRDYVPQLVNAYHAHDEPLVPFPDTVSVLADLAQVHEIGLLTGGTKGQEKLRRLGITSHFDSVCVTAGTDTSKREADPFLDVLSDLGVQQSDSVYVGDRPRLDFVQPNRIGMGTVRILNGQYATRSADGEAEPTAVVDTLRDLPDVLLDIR